jgi:two-component system, NtrC family, sensor histidine kinase KinB
MQLRKRLLVSHGLIIIWMILLFPIALYAMHRLTVLEDVLVSGYAHGIEAVERIRAELDAEIARLLQVSLPLSSVGASGNADDSGAATAPRTAVEEARSQFASASEKTAFDEFERHYIHFENALAIWRSGQMTQASAAQLSSDFNDVGGALRHLHEVKDAELAAGAGATLEFAHNMLFLLGTIGALALLVGLLATIRLVRSVVRPVEQLNGLVERMSQGDFEISHRQGSIDEFNTLGRHFETMGGALRLFRETNLDRIVTEQRRTNAVLNSIGDGLVIFSEDATIERINPVAERQLGLEPDTAMAQRFEDLGWPKIGARVREVLEIGEFAAFEDPEVVVERDGEDRVLVYWLQRFEESESGRPGVVMVMRDVTAQRQFDKMRSEFVLRASHELRTPITSIRMGVELLGETMRFPPGSRGAELYITVQQELKRAVSLLTDLLDFSRLRAGQQVSERVPTDIGEMLTQARQRFAMAASHADVTLEMDVEEHLPRLPLGRSEFDRVLDNLLANALRHTPQGGSVTLSARRTSERIAIAVIDSGQGIPYSKQALIFQPFVQIGARRGGAGLGLAICKEIVQQHRGEIRVSSVPQRGATFTILLPA